MDMLSASQDYVAFLQGVLSILLGLCALSLARRRIALLPWFWLAAYGFLHGGYEWLEMLTLGTPNGIAWHILGSTVMTGSLLPLIVFGRRGMQRPGGRPLGRWIYLPFLLLVAATVLSRQKVAWHELTQYALGLLSAGLPVLALWQTSRSAQREERGGLRIAAAGLFAYSLAAGFVTVMVLSSVSSANSGLSTIVASMPVQLAQVVCAGVGAYGLWRVEQEASERDLDPNTFRIASMGGWHLVASLAIVLIFGWGFAAGVASVTDAQMRDELLTQARMLAQALDPNRIQALSGTASDLTSPDYLQLKERLSAVRNSNPQVRFIYLMGKRDRDFFFYVDSEPPGSEDYSPPGQIYTEAALEIDWWQDMFRQATDWVGGPDTDRWGVWMDAMVPILEPQTNSVMALMGMDVAAANWEQRIWRADLLPITLTLILVLLLIGIHVLNRHGLEAQYRIAASEKRYRRFLQNFSGIAYQADPLTLKPTLMFGMVSEMTGFVADDFLSGRVAWAQIIHPDDRTRIGEEKLDITCDASIDDEYRIVHRDGRISWIRDIAGYISENGSSFIQGVIYDVTERKRAEETLKRAKTDLERSNADLEQFAYVASHDLQEPLRAVASFVQLLSYRYKDQLDTDANEFIGYAVDGVHRMQQLILDLLAYSKVDTRGKTLTMTDANVAYRQAVASLRALIIEHSAIVTCDPLPTVETFDDQLVLVLQHLICNAITFHGTQAPRVHISARQEGDAWVFSVQDNGIGIEPAYFDRIFLIFQRLHGIGVYPGTGIGLATCKKIIERHGGRIWVESQPGQGSIFYFTLPI